MKSWFPVLFLRVWFCPVVMLHRGLCRKFVTLFRYYKYFTTSICILETLYAVSITKD